MGSEFNGSRAQETRGINPDLRWRRYICRRCGKPIHKQLLEPLPLSERYCPKCWFDQALEEMKED